MIRLSARKIISALVVMFMVPSLTGLDFGSGLAAGSPEGQNLGQGSLVAVLAGHGDTLSRVPPPKTFSELRIQSATINVTFLEGVPNAWGYNCGTWSSEARAAFQYAVSIWASLITSAIPIEVEACWTNLGSGVLGSAGPADYWRNFSGAPLPDTWYPNPLANKLAGADLDPTKHDINAMFNSNFGSWYYGTDGNTPLDRWDFVSVVLHELGHGLGFVGSMAVDDGIYNPGQGNYQECNGTAGVGCWGSGTAYPFAYDHFTENGSAQSLINTGLFPNPSTALANQLQSGGVFWDGTNANAANGGSRPELYAPNPWEKGSSYSHLDEDVFPKQNENALMTPVVDNGESHHSPGPVMLGIFQDMGWTTAQVSPDLSIVKQIVGPWNPDPGEPVTFTLSIENVGTASASGIVVTDTLPAEILMPSTANTFGVTPRGGTTYVWDLPDLLPTASGVITIYGTISSTLPSDYAIWNTATISTEDDESSTSNNSSTALVGGNRIFMPLVLKNQ